MKRLLFAPLAALLVGCGQGAVAEPKGAREAEASAYKYALSANDVAAIALDAAALSLRATVRAEAARTASRCQGTGDALKACEHQGALDALSRAKPAADKIDEASKAQLAVRSALIEYEQCTPGLADRLCQAAALAKVVTRAPAVTEAVEAARKALRNAAPAQ